MTEQRTGRVRRLTQRDVGSGAVESEQDEERGKSWKAVPEETRTESRTRPLAIFPWAGSQTGQGSVVEITRGGESRQK